MNDEKLKGLLSAYTVPNAKQDQIEMAQQKAQAAMIRTIPTRPFSLWTQIKVQATYLSKWFYLSCGLIALLCLGLNAVANIERSSSAFFGVSPLFILPCASAVHRTFSCKMLELETACKYSLTRLLTGKMIVLGGVVSALILFIGVLAGFKETAFTLRPFLLSFGSFALTATVILWFGKNNMIRGLICGCLWAVGTVCLSLWDVGCKYINNVSTGVILLVSIFGLVTALLSVYRYIKEFSYEGANESWNFSLTA